MIVTFHKPSGGTVQILSSPTTVFQPPTEQQMQAAAEGIRAQVVDEAVQAAQSVVTSLAQDVTAALDTANTAAALVAPNIVSTGAAPVASGWAGALWTSGEQYDPRLTVSLPDHTYPIALSLEGIASVTLTNNQQITSKTVYRRQSHSDLLITARYTATGTDAASLVYAGVYHSNGTINGRERRGQTPVLGSNTITHAVPAAYIYNRLLYRPFVRFTGTGSIGVEYLQITELT